MIDLTGKDRFRAASRLNLAGLHTNLIAKKTITPLIDLPENDPLHLHHFPFQEPMRPDLPFTGGLDDDGGEPNERTINIHGSDA